MVLVRYLFGSLAKKTLYILSDRVTCDFWRCNEFARNRWLEKPNVDWRHSMMPIDIFPYIPPLPLDRFRCSNRPIIQPVSQNHNFPTDRKVYFDVQSSTSKSSIEFFIYVHCSRIRHSFSFVLENISWW